MREWRSWLPAKHYILSYTKYLHMYIRPSRIQPSEPKNSDYDKYIIST
jgi:hypothetical protein